MLECTCLGCAISISLPSSVRMMKVLFTKKNVLFFLKTLPLINRWLWFHRVFHRFLLKFCLLYLFIIFASPFETLKISDKSSSFNSILFSYCNNANEVGDSKYVAPKLASDSFSSLCSIWLSIICINSWANEKRCLFFLQPISSI